MQTNTRWARAVAVMFIGAALVVGAASPASASTIYGPYFNGATGKYEGSFSWIDCSCPDDGALTLSNVVNGYSVRARVYATVNGTYYKYLDKNLPDGYSAKWATGYPLKGATVRVQLCFLDANYVQRGSCENHYTINSTY
jgi:hypothetical protein